MAKTGDINPVQAQRKKEKDLQIKKAKLEREKQRLQRLSTRNPRRIESQIETLKAKDSLSTADETYLKTLEADLADIKKAQQLYGGKELSNNPTVHHHQNKPHVNRNESKHKVQGQGRRSIFWDPLLNPYGIAPPGFPALTRSLFSEPNFVPVDISHIPDEIKNIPLPNGPPPRITRFELHQQANDNNNNIGENSVNRPPAATTPTSTLPSVKNPKTIYEAQPQLRDLRSESIKLVPAAVRKRNQKLATAKLDGNAARNDATEKVEEGEMEDNVEDIIIPRNKPIETMVYDGGSGNTLEEDDMVGPSIPDYSDDETVGPSVPEGYSDDEMVGPSVPEGYSDDEMVGPSVPEGYSDDEMVGPSVPEGYSDDEMVGPSVPEGYSDDEMVGPSVPEGYSDDEMVGPPSEEANSIGLKRKIDQVERHD